MLCHEVIDDGKSHVRIDGAGTITEEQSGVHHLAYLTTLDYKSGLYALAYADKVMMYGTYSEQ